MLAINIECWAINKFVLTFYSYDWTRKNLIERITITYVRY